MDQAGIVTGVAFLSQGIEEQIGDAVVVAGAIIALLTLYAALRSQLPFAAKAMAMPFRLVWRIIVWLFFIPRWIWRQIWRDDEGVTRGPFTRLADRIHSWVTGVIRETVDPKLETVRVAAKEQHDEQNEKIDAQTAYMVEGFEAVQERLDKGSEIMAKHAELIDEFKAHLDGSRPHNQRATDPKE